MGDPIDFWRSSLSDVRFNYRSRSKNIIDESRTFAFSRWEDLFSIIEDRSISYYTFPSASLLEVEDGWLHSDVTGEDFLLHDSQFFIEIKFDLSMKIFLPQKGDDQDLQYSTLFPRMEIWVTKKKYTTPSLPLIDLTFFRQDYECNDNINSVQINGNQDLDYFIRNLIITDFTFRNHVRLFCEERDKIYNNIMYPRGFLKNIKTILKSPSDAHRDSFIKNQHRTNCVALEFMELDMIIGLFDRIRLGI
jgi:hypothetical protein